MTALGRAEAMGLLPADEHIATLDMPSFRKAVRHIHRAGIARNIQLELSDASGSGLERTLEHLNLALEESPVPEFEWNRLTHVLGLELLSRLLGTSPSKGFWLGRTEVTQEAWKRVMRTDPSHFKGAALPVQEITWNDAQKYCQSVDMRLPTEAEWVYAARAGKTESRYGALDDIAWHGGNSQGKTHEVGGKQPNAWGLYDMLGNVFEWVGDGWVNHYEPGAATDPQVLSGAQRVLRGGSWDSYPRDARASYRIWGVPEGHGNYLGVRCGGN